MKKTIFSYSAHQRLAYAWLTVVSLLVASLFYLLPQSKINNSVLDLLPKEQIEGVPTAIVDSFTQRLDRQLVWLISPTQNSDLTVVRWWQKQLQQIPTLQNIRGEMDQEKQQQWGRFLLRHKEVLLDSETRNRIMQQQHVDWVLSQIYSPFSGVSQKELEQDPLLLMRSSQLQQQNHSRLLFDQGWLTTKDQNGRLWYLIYGQLANSSYDISNTRNTVNQLNDLQQQLHQRWPGTLMLQRGTLFYSDYASQQAERDISTIGIASISGIILLLFVVFRSSKPIWLTLLSISVGILCGCVAVLLSFGQIHIMTLVMSTSVVGISIDYAIHFLSERMLHGEQENSLASLKKLLPALSAALISSAIAYSMLLLAPFPGLKQLAVFAVAGLSGAFLTVICWYPKLAEHLPARPAPFIAVILWWLYGWRKVRCIKWGVPLIFTILAIIGISQVKINDDISQLQALPNDLRQQEQRIAELTGQNSDQKWFIIYGDTPQQTLERLEHFVNQLQHPLQQNWLTSYRLFPLPSIKQQQQNLILVEQAKQQLPEQLMPLGSNEQIKPTLLEPDPWLNSPLSEGWRLLWLSEPNGQSAILLPVQGVNNADGLKLLAQQTSGVHWIDRKTEFDELFSLYRTYLSQILALAVAIISLFFLLRFGISSTIPTLLSIAMGLALLGFSGLPLNLFSLLALVLVLGIGIDYTLFFSNSKVAPVTSMVSISLAAMTTLLSFGLLVLSHTQAIASFGLVLSAGILTAFLLSPLAIQRNKK